MKKITAQDRGLLNQLRDKTNVAGKVLERINPEFHEMMEHVRTTDESIRTTVKDIKNVVRAASSLVRRRDYLSAAVNFSAFHEKCRYVAAKLEKLKSTINLKHYKFLLDQFDDEHKEQLFGYDPNKKITANIRTLRENELIKLAIKKDAGLSDWWFSVTDPIGDMAHNLVKERGIAMRALEKRFSIAFLRELKISSNSMADRTEQFLQFLIVIYKRLATALATRNLEAYLKYSEDFVNKFAEYHKKFIEYHEKSVLPLKKQNDKLQEEIRQAEENKSKQVEDEAELKRNPTAVVKPNLNPIHPVPLPEPLPMKDEKISLIDRLEDSEKGETPNRSFIPSVPTSISNKPEKLTYENEIVPSSMQRRTPGSKRPLNPVQPGKQASIFLNKLEKFASNNDVKSIIEETLKYAALIEEKDENSCLKLVSIAEKASDNYKMAGIFDFVSNDNDNDNDEEEESQVSNKNIKDLSNLKRPIPLQ